MSELAEMTRPDQHTEAEARSLTYRLFAKLIAHPDEAMFEALSSGEVVATFADLAKDLPFALPFDPAGIRSSVKNMSHDDLSALYTSRFEVGNAPVSLYGRTYVREGERELFEDLFRFYEHFGLRFDDGKARDWPDALVVGLEFMHYLSFIEASRGGSSAAINRAQHDFLGRHLARWCSKISEVLARQDVKLYATILAALDAFVLADLGRLTALSERFDQ